MALFKSKLLVEKIFDPDMGWDYSSSDVPITKGNATDGNPYFIVEVDGIEILVFQISEWEAGVSSNVSPHRIVVTTSFPDVEITDPVLLLKANSSTSFGLPSWGLDADGSPNMVTAFPTSPDFSVDLARRQVLVCMGIISEEARDFIQGLSEGENKSDWSTANNVAKVAGSFLRALLDL